MINARDVDLAMLGLVLKKTEILFDFRRTYLKIDLCGVNGRFQGPNDLCYWMEHKVVLHLFDVLKVPVKYIVGVPLAGAFYMHIIASGGLENISAQAGVKVYNQPYSTAK